MDGTSAIAHIEIKISGFNNDNPIIFSGFVLNEAMLSVNNFSFALRPPNNEGSLTAILNTKKELLGKDIEIKLSNVDSTASHVFNGFISEVSAHLSSDEYYEFFVIGCGKFGKLDEVPEFHSYYQKSLTDIVKAAFNNTSISSDVKIDTSVAQQHYIVQYNRTPFSFIADLAIRFGEWMFYDGNQLKFGKLVEGEAIALHTSRNEVSNLNIRAKTIKPPESSVSTDIYKSEVLHANKKEPEPSNDFLKVSFAGGGVIENPGKKIFTPSGFNKESIDSIHKKMQEAIVSSSVFLTGNTHHANISVGSVIKIIDAENASGLKYIITQITHNAPHAHSYTNSFTAVPFEVTVPPYTNPLLFPMATIQAAIVTDNEDDKGLDRVKVRFPWMLETEKSPWISVSVPHAGSEKGFRFLPEIDDEVLISFWDNNAELPYVNGAVYTERNKSGVPEGGNHVKSIGTKTGRRIQIDDNGGTIKISDVGAGASGNLFKASKKDSDMKIIISSGSESESLCVSLDASNKKIGISGLNGGAPIVEVTLDMQQQKVTMMSQGDMEFVAGGNISMQAGGNVTMSTGGNLDVTVGRATTITTTNNYNLTVGAGMSQSVGQNTEISSGQNISLAAGLKLETIAATEISLIAGAQAMVMAPLVKIN